jgi:predicted CXXCH cytochrome family protein
MRILANQREFRATSSLLLVGALAMALWFGPLAAAEAAPPGQDATPAPETVAITADEQCLACHSEPDQVMALPSGEELYISLDAGAVSASVHSQAEVGCRDCHAIESYPHPELAARSLRQVTINASEQCQSCHADEASREMDSIHRRLRLEGNEAAAVCADCHNPHYSRLAAPRSSLIATCARCHSGVAQEFYQSVHGASLQAQENADVPSCTDCHGVHIIRGPHTAGFVARSPQLCARCHTDPARMAPYGLNTGVLDTYVADFHGTTQVLFQRQTLDQAPNTPLCIDCHGIHNIKSVSDEASQVMKANLLVTCQKCHPDATTNFSDAWLSHYRPSPEHNPLVYYVGLFYRVFIPGALGGMALFVATDAGRRLADRRRAAGQRRSRGKAIDPPPAGGETGPS